MLFMRFLPAALVLFVAVTAHGFEQQEYTTETFTSTYILPYIDDFTETPEGGVAWDLLAATKEVPWEEFNEDGFMTGGLRPEFSEELKALNGQDITMQGFMFPLDPTEKQAHFLFGPFPLTCPYHYHVGPALVIETHAAQPVSFSYEPVTLEGRLELVPEDDEFNIFYRLHEARTVE